MKHLLFIGYLLLFFVLPCRAQNIPEMLLAPVKENGKWGYVDEKGSYVIRPKFEIASDFSQDLAAVKINNKWGFINQVGDYVVEPQFDDAYSFSGSLARVKNGDLWGYVDLNGNYAISPQFSTANDFSEGLALVKQNEKYGYINSKGQFVMQPIFEDAYDFSEGLALVSQMGKWGYINKQKELLELPPYCQASEFFSEGLSVVCSNKKYGYVGKDAYFAIQTQFDAAHDFSEGLAAAAFNKQFGYINYEGNFVIVPAFEKAAHFSEGLAAVSIGGQYGYIDTKGSLVIAPQFDEAQPFNDGIAKVTIANKQGYIDRKGEWVVSANYKWLFDFSEGLAAAEWQGKYGYVTTHNAYQISPTFDGAGAFKKTKLRTASLKPIIALDDAPDGKSVFVVEEPRYVLKATILTNSPLLDRMLFVNNNLIDLDDIAMRGTRIVPIQKNGNNYGMNLEITVPLVEGKNKVYLKAVNQSGAIVSETREIVYKPAQNIEKPNLYVLTVGISEFQYPEYNIQYADDDAEDFANMFAQQQQLPQDQRLYGKVVIEKLQNAQATAQNVKKAILQMKKIANPKDLFILHVSSHGEIDTKGNYYIRTYESEPGIDFLSASALENRWLAEQIRDFNCTTVQFVDACHSGSVGDKIALKGSNNIDIAVRELKEALSSKALYFFASSGQQQMSQERGEWKNGAFTEAILSCFNGKKMYSENKPIEPDTNKDGFISTNEINEYVSKAVRVLTNGEQTPKTTIENGEPINLFVVRGK